jgi:transcriptional regulator with XRE-family HTH domain
MRNISGPHPSSPATTQGRRFYSLRVRNTEERRQAWSEYVTRIRRASGISGAAMARRLDVSESAVSRWTNGENVPEAVDVLERFAALFALDLDEVLDAAGMRPGTDDSAETIPEYDPEVERILADKTLTPASKEYLLDVLTSERDRAKAQITERMDWHIDKERRRAG